MKICLEKVLNLEDGEHHFDFVTKGREIVPEKVDFEGTPVFANDIHTHIRLQKSGHTYRVSFQAETTVHQLCDRCLDEVPSRITGDFEIIYAERKRDDAEDSDDWRTFNPMQTNQIDLDKDVHDTLVLALPTKSLCREDCRGLCPECGSNLNERICEHAEQHVEN